MSKRKLDGSIPCSSSSLSLEECETFRLKEPRSKMSLSLDPLRYVKEEPCEEYIPNDLTFNNRSSYTSFNDQKDVIKIGSKPLFNFNLFIDDNEDISLMENYQNECDEYFVKTCRKIGIPDHVVRSAWDILMKSQQCIVLEGSMKSWQCVVIYYYYLLIYLNQKEEGNQFVDMMPINLNQLLDCFQISTIEFFDKVNRFSNILCKKKLGDVTNHIKKTQGQLAISTVSFKKFIHLFRIVFKNDEDRGSSKPLGSPSLYDIFQLSWLLIIILQKRLDCKELVDCVNLVICVIETVFMNIIDEVDGGESQVNEDFASVVLEQGNSILHVLCYFLKAVHIELKCFQNQKYNDAVCGYRIERMRGDMKSLMHDLNKDYEKILLTTGAIDERVFVLKKDDFRRMFHPNFNEDNVVEILRVANKTNFTDSDLLHKISMEISSKRYYNGMIWKMKPEMIKRVPFPSTDISNELTGDIELSSDKSAETSLHEGAERLKNIALDYNFETSKLRAYCDSMSDDPSVTLLLKRDIMTEKFQRKLNETGSNCTAADKRFIESLNIYQEMLANMFLMLIEKIFTHEINRKSREDEILNVLRRDEFLDSVFCFCIELILFSFETSKTFPFSCELCDIHPFTFQKIIDLLVNIEKNLTRSMVKHFNMIEERIIEELAWEKQSPLWDLLPKYPFSEFSQFGDDWFEKGQSPLKFVRKKSLRREIEKKYRGYPRALRLFLKKVYFMVAIRLQDMCDRLNFNDRQRAQAWTLFDYELRNATAQFLDRHVDQITLCILYVVSKLNDSGKTFMEIIAQYKRQPQASADIYRKVVTYLPENVYKEDDAIPEMLNAQDAKPHIVDLITYYNCEFRECIKLVVPAIDNAPMADLLDMPVPTAYGITPFRIHINKQVTVKPLSNDESAKERIIVKGLKDHGISFDTFTSHRNDLDLINLYSSAFKSRQTGLY